VREDGAFELLQPPARLDPEVVDQHAPRCLIRLERLGLAARPVKRKHKLRPQPLPVRMLRNQRVELGDERLVLAEREVGLDPLLERR